MTIKFKLEQVITEFQYYDAAKLMFGLSVFWLYTFFSQFLPIWYANMPEETGFIASRVFDEPYKSLSWAILTCIFVIPFVTLIPRTTKVVKPILVTIASISFLGLYEMPEPLNLQLNPDVTVRSRGIMEKCNFCIQRITAAKDVARDEDRKLRDGEVETACQSVCGCNAIVFGDLNEPSSKVSKMVEDKMFFSSRRRHTRS